MSSVCFYFQVHQPYRLRPFRVFDIGSGGGYFNDDSERDTNNAQVLHKVARKCYLPTNELLYELLTQHPEFRIAFSLSGVFIEQLEQYAPDVLASFQKLVNTGQVEILSETYYHSLAHLYSQDEFAKQIIFHRDKMEQVFGVTPRVFRNTELIYNDALARSVASLGYKGVLAEGADHVLGWRSPNFLYHTNSTPSIPLLLKNYRLSDDVAFRFSETEWKEHPLTAEKFAQWVHQVNGNGDVVNLFMDYETFGEHQWEETGIFDFLKALPAAILTHPDTDFVTPSEAIERYPTRDTVSVHDYMSWADVERDLSAWRSNALQHNAFDALYRCERDVLATRDPELIHDWRLLQTSDHFYYMCTKWFADGDVHTYFNPYETPHDAYLSFMNVLRDLSIRVSDHHHDRPHDPYLI